MQSQQTAVYFAENQAISATEFIQIACAPETSVVVEACAGSGKTWLLVARILRLLLSGVAPHEILAITFTRKAAGEMHSRLLELLQDLASQSEQQVIEALVQRGLSPNQAQTALPQARQLYERVLAAPSSISIDTFHGWFIRLLRGAPLSSGIAPGQTLQEKVIHLRNEAWQTFWKHLGKPTAQLYRHAYEQLLDELGEYQTQTLLDEFFFQRANWWALTAQTDAYQVLAQKLNPGQTDTWLALAETALISLSAKFLLIAKALAEGSPAESKRAQTIITCYEKLQQTFTPDNALQAVQSIFTEIWSVFFTEKGTARALKPTKGLTTTLGTHGIDNLLDNYAGVCSTLEQIASYLEEDKALRINKALFILGEALITCYQNAKADQRSIDFVDLEWHATRLLHDSETAAYLQLRLDARYRHILIDEFQDTNPLQWHILLGWLDGYSHADEAPRIFLVGDPKQSIYRFRGADARLFGRAREYLCTRFQTRTLHTAYTRRNSKAVLDWVNAVFTKAAQTGGMPNYIEQGTALAEKTYSACHLLPLIACDIAQPLSTNETATTSDASFQWRDSLAPPIYQEQESLYFYEGCQAAAWIKQCQATMPITTTTSETPACWSDFLLLVRRKEHFIDYERALRIAGIPCVSMRQGGLLTTLEILDLIALLKFLMTPADNLSLAHVLKSPIFSATDHDLLHLRNRSIDISIQNKRAQPARLNDQPIHSTINWWASLTVYAQEQDCSSNLKVAYQKLYAWLTCAEHLSVHDLLDHIYASGALKKRYAQSVPVELRQQVNANLDSFLYLALELEGGRYPSLAKFVDSLEAMQRGAVTESPDEGQITHQIEDGEETANTDAEINAVRILTIHAAKGLEAPFVLLLDANYSSRQETGPSILMNWPPDSPTPQHFSAWGKGWRGQKRNDVFAEENKIATQETWNLLYVAMTRAQQVFAVSGVARSRGDEQGMIADSWYAQLANVDVAQAWSATEQIAKPIDPKIIAQKNPIVFYQDFQAESKAPIANLAIPVQQNASAIHGQHVHYLLERITRQGIDTIPADLELAKWLKAPLADSQAVIDTVKRIIQSPNCQRFFKPENYLQAWNEIELFSSEGRLLRIDRLIEFADEWLILDFKTGMQSTTDINHDYVIQLQDYATALAQIYHDKPIRAALISEIGEVVEVSVDIHSKNSE